jgi:hypothetical protein
MIPTRCTYNGFRIWNSASLFIQCSMTGYKSRVCAISCILASTSNSLLTMEKSSRWRKCSENEKGTIEIHQKVGGSVDRNFDPEKCYPRSILETWNRQEAREKNSPNARYPSSTVPVPTLSAILLVSLALSTRYCSLRAVLI